MQGLGISFDTAFLSRLFGGEHDYVLITTYNAFLSRLFGGELGPS